MMEEATANVRVEVNESHRRNVTPNQMISQEEINVSATTDEVIENPEYVVVRRSTTVQAVAREEIVIPKQDTTLAQSSESGNTVEMDISSQESAMDIASQESLSVEESNPYELPPFKSSFDPSSMMSAEAVMKNMKKLLACKNPRKRKQYMRIEKLENEKRGKLIAECRARLKRVQEMLDKQEKAVFNLHSDMEDSYDYFVREHYLSVKRNQELEEESEDEEYEDNSPCAGKNVDDFLPLKRARKG